MRCVQYATWAPDFVLFLADVGILEVNLDDSDRQFFKVNRENQFSILPPASSGGVCFSFE